MVGEVGWEGEGGGGGERSGVQQFSTGRSDL